MEETTDQKRGLNFRRPRASSQSSVEVNRNITQAGLLHSSDRNLLLAAKRTPSPDKAGLCDIDSTIIFSQSKANLEHGIVIDGINGIIVKKVLDVLWESGIRDLYLFTRMRSFSLEEEGPGSVMERLRLINYLENQYRYSSLEEERKEGFNIPGIITAQDYTFHIPLIELSTFINACGTEALPEVLLQSHPEQYKNIAILRDAVTSGAFIHQQFTVGMAFGHALCELYAKNLREKGTLLSKSELSTLKKHLKKLISRERLANRQNMEKLVAKKFDRAFKQGQSFKQACKDLSETELQTYNFSTHSLFAQQVSDVLVGFCTTNKEASKILMFTQFLRDKPMGVKTIVVADDIKAELKVIEAHPFCTPREDGSLPVVTLRVKNIQMPKEKMAARLASVGAEKRIQRSVDVSPAISPMITPPSSSGSDDDDKDKLPTHPRRSWLPTFGLGLKSKQTSSSTDDLMGQESSSGLRKKSPRDPSAK